MRRLIMCWLSIGVLGAAACGEDTGQVQMTVRPDPGSTVTAGTFTMRVNWAGNVGNPTADFTLDGDEGKGGALEGRQVLLDFPSAWLRDGAEIPVNRINGGQLYFFDVKTFPFPDHWEDLATGLTSSDRGTELSRGWHATCGVLKVKEHTVLGDGIRRFVLEGKDIRLGTLGYDHEENFEPALLDVTIRINRSDYIFPEGQGTDLISHVGIYDFEVPPSQPPAPLCDAPIVTPASPPPLVTRQKTVEGTPFVLDRPGN